MTTIAEHAEHADLDRLLELYRELAEGDPARAPSHAAAARSALSAILSDGNHHLCVAAANARVVGAAELIVVPNLTHHCQPWAVIENVIVERPARGHGTGTQLLEHLLTIARECGCYKVQLHSGKQRINAHRVYQRLGFRAVAEGFKLYYDETQTGVSG